MLYRVAVKKGMDVSAAADLSAYADVASISGYAAEAMQWAVAAGIISGMDAVTLAPQGNATRAQIATIMMRFCAL